MNTYTYNKSKGEFFLSQNEYVFKKGWIATMDNSNKKDIKKSIVTSVDVARHAKVSQASVSRAFTPDSSMSDKMRTKILKAAHELGYTPNAIARGLISQKTNIIGVVMDNPANPFYSLMLGEFTEKLKESGRQTLLFNAATDAELEHVIRAISGYRVDGIILTIPNRISEFNALGIPLVLFNRRDFDEKISAVCCDNVQSGRLVADYVVDRKYKEIAFMGGLADSSTTIDRRKGFADGLKERGVGKLTEINGDYTFQSGYDATRRLYEKNKNIDAIFCANDLMAIGAIEYIKFGLKKRVPEDVSVIGFDDITEASWPSFDLTTIHQPIKRMITETIRVLDDQIKGEEVKPTINYYNGELVIRKSTK
ncbi:LacI family DNA-binding transcriptional regulator [Alkalibacter rhizosphaerae]|uniref:LacI family DNA-binding transcriptional regulator n=1 Tax=Alkalibacter rhizosphaerae TaxID=2815577 RepID=A0A974XD96_9FIRM|nr:LacI family DNA-binding transcriptional regulator [Alkalibacter rhizosphaerae]QSX07694.1 LacI family DNA-binding transcriptional regulator [Alkalibacter rhizosphaerae]